MLFVYTCLWCLYRCFSCKQIIETVEGKAIVFDDSFEHEAWNDGNSARITLVFDIWHPDLTQREVCLH
jgi:aspartyl/asparaginyl beta-hydroxylase (cupin superfamily)